MAVVTITEILGGDNIAASRVVINNNFTLLQNAINTLETRLNTSYTPGGALNVGSIQALKYTRAISTNIFLVQASAQIDGNLSLGTATNPSTLALTGSATVSQALTIDGNVNFDNDGDTKVFTNSAQNIVNDSFSNAQWYGPTTKQQEQVVSTGGAHSVVITDNTNVIRLDIQNVVAATILTMPDASTVTAGQIVTLAFDSAYQTAANRAFTLATTNMDPAYGTNLALNNAVDSSTDAIGKCWITLVAATNGWRVIGASPSVTNW